MPVDPGPKVTSLQPSSGSASGASIVQITGSGFTGATAVHFGVAAAASFTVVSDQAIQAVAPPGSGTVEVTVTGPGGTSATNAAGQFSYHAIPSVTSIKPSRGSALGGDAITISGEVFTGVTAVRFGNTPAASFTVVSDVEIQAFAPPSSGAVNVTVTGPGGTSVPKADNRAEFLYNNLTLDVLRPDDLLALRIEFFNMALDPGTPRIVRMQRDQPAFMVVHFPPQHLAEQVIVENEDGSLQGAEEPPVGSILAGESRLALRMPDDVVAIPLTLKDLLNWIPFEPHVPANALATDASNGPALDPRGGGPAPQETAIELPYRVVLSPDSSAGWAHALDGPVVDEARAELWHTRLGVRAAARVDESVRPATRAVWSPDLVPASIATPSPDLAGPLSPSNRKDIARLSSDWSLEVASRWKPVPLEVEQLMLSALGGWLRVRSQWNYPRGTHADEPALQEWQQITAMGRDQYVRVVERGFLFPLGHRAVTVSVSERKFKPAPAAPGESVAYLAQRVIIVVQEAEKDYALAADLQGGRALPFRRVRITTLATPAISVAADHWVMDHDQLFRFHIVAVDHAGQSCDFGLPLMFILESDALIPDVVTTLSQNYLAADASHRAADLRGQRVAFAPSVKPGDTTLKAATLSFRGKTDHLDTALLPPGHPPFLPAMDTAQVSIPAVDHLLASVGTGGATTIQFHDTYLSTALGQLGNQGEVYAAVVTKLPLRLPPECAGGLAQPNITVDGLSRSLGPLAEAAALAGGHFDPQTFFSGAGSALGAAKLLGGITLQDIVQTVTDASFADQVPKLTNLRQSDAVVAKLDWNPKINIPPDPTPTDPTPTDPNPLPLRTGSDTTLVITSTSRAPFDGTPPTSDVSGTLAHFGLEFFGAIRLDFDSMAFHAVTGNKLDLDIRGVRVKFEGRLEFINALRDLLPSTGLSHAPDPQGGPSPAGGPDLAVGPEGVTAGYSLAIPKLGFGIFSLENIALAASLFLPFVDKPAALRFAFSERHHPFLLSVSLLGGGGFCALRFNTGAIGGIEQVEAALEFGGNFSLDLVIASLNVHALAGIYFSYDGSSVQLAGYLRLGGSAEVLGLITISFELYLGLTYDSSQKAVSGKASLSVGVHLAFWSTSVTLTVERKFAKPANDPTFEQLVDTTAWQSYCRAFT